MVAPKGFYEEKLTGKAAVINILNPFATNPVYLGNTNIDVGAPVRTVVRLGEAALGTAGLLAAKVGILAKAGIAGATYIAGGAITNSPKLQSVSEKVVSQAPSDISKFGPNVGAFVEDPSMSSFKNIFSDSPITSTTLAVGGAIVGGKVVSNAVSGYTARKTAEATEDYAKEAKKQTELLEKQLNKEPSIPPTPSIPPPPPVVLPSNPIPVTPDPKTLPTTPIPQDTPVSNPIISADAGTEPKSSNTCKDNLKKRLKYRKNYKVEEYYKRK